MTTNPTGPSPRPVLPPLRSIFFGLVALIPLAGAGLVVWGLPLERPLGQPGTSREVPVTATDLRLPLVSNSPGLAADPTASRFVALAHRIDGPDLGCGLQVSGDGGESWVGADPVPVLPPGVERCHAPEVAFDGRGTLYYLFVGLVGQGLSPKGAFLTTSGDRARTFSPPRRVLGPLGYGVRMAVEQGRAAAGRVHLVWLQAGAEPTARGFASLANPVMAAHSDDGGSHFSEPVVVGEPAGRRLAAPALALGPAGRVHVAYYDLGDDGRDYEGQPGATWEGRWSLAVATSTDRGGRFGPSVTVDGAIVPPSRVRSVFTMAPPALVAGRQRTCLAWTDGRHGDADVLLRCSLPGARRWTAPKRVNDDARGNGQWQYLPQLAMAPNGRLDVAFYDRRGDLRNVVGGAGFAYSYDGQRFSPNTALSRLAFSFTIGPETAGSGTGPVEFGSRLALLSQESSALAAWTDTRNIREGAVAQDVYAARASLLFAARRPAWALGAGFSVMAVGGAALALLSRRGKETR